MIHREPYPLTADGLLSRVLYRDNLLLVLNKPSGIPVHPGPRKAGPSLEDFFEALRFDYKETPKLAHRLDRDTSGCLVLGRNQRALQKLGRLFETGSIKKTYWAVVHGGPAEDSGIVEGYLEKVKTPKGWYMKVSGKNENSQTAVTAWKVLRREKDRAWLELYPQTGRTHQIRVHCQSLGCPIIGDWVYGPEAEATGPVPPLHLHARSIEIPIYEDKEPVCVEAPAPEHINL